MKNIIEIATLFLAFFGFGSSVVLSFFPLRATGQSFVRYYTGQNLFFQIVFLFCLWRLGRLDYAHMIIVGLSAWTWVVSFMSQEISRIELFLVRALSVVSFLFLVEFTRTFITPPLTGAAAIAPLTIFISGALFISAFLANMIFGHWYLVNKELDICYLVTSSRQLLVLTYLRVATVIASLSIAYKSMPPDAFARLIDFMGHGVFFWARVLAGLLVPVIVAHLSYESAKIKANQSATGILYAGCVFVIMGELIALYLFVLTGIAF